MKQLSIKTLIVIHLILGVCLFVGIVWWDLALLIGAVLAYATGAAMKIAWLQEDLLANIDAQLAAAKAATAAAEKLREEAKIELMRAQVHADREIADAKARFNSVTEQIKYDCQSQIRQAHASADARVLAAETRAGDAVAAQALAEMRAGKQVVELQRRLANAKAAAERHKRKKPGQHQPAH